MWGRWKGAGDGFVLTGGGGGGPGEGKEERSEKQKRWE